ncbi:MAG: hypothetical protein IPL79_09650 [Myxococcales bacterium]|nr:hypothetical protein [Myxococcales bacterium]
MTATAAPASPEARDALAAIHAAEVALVAAAGHWHAASVAPAWAYAVVASKFLAASSPHSLGLYWDHEAWAGANLAASVAGFAAVFHPRDVRVVATRSDAATAPTIAPPPRAVRYRDVMAADVVMHVGDAPELVTPRGGSHVVWVSATPPPFAPTPTRPTDIFAAASLGASEACAALPPGWQKLSDIVAGRIDGRQLDEITVTWLCINDA